MSSTFQMMAIAHWENDVITVSDLQPLDPCALTLMQDSQGDAITGLTVARGIGAVTVWLKWPDYRDAEMSVFMRNPAFQRATEVALASAIEKLLDEDQSA